MAEGGRNSGPDVRRRETARDATSRRASDGARASVHLAGHVSAGMGTVLVTTAVSAGWVLSAAGEAIAFIPNELGAALLYNERVTR